MDLTKQYFQLKNNGQAKLWEASSFWDAVMGSNSEQIDNASEGYLLSSYVFDKNWETWERHPAGDEVVIVVQGQLEIIFDYGERQETTIISEGETFLIPKNTWHTGKVEKPCHAIFLTYGRGTEHRAN